jgi:hypothetical protein
MTTTKPNPLEQSGGLFTSRRHSSTYEYISPLKFNLEGKHVLVLRAQEHPVSQWLIYMEYRKTLFSD